MTKSGQQPPSDETSLSLEGGDAGPDAVFTKFCHACCDQMMAQDDGVSGLPGLLELSESLHRDLVSGPDGWQALDCRAGCNHCCSLPVKITPQHLFFIAQTLQNLLPEEGLSQLRAELSVYVRHWARQPAAQRHAARIPCAFLDEEGGCSIYEIRPLSCRAFTSPDAVLCRRLADGAGEEVPQHPPTYRLYQMATTGMVGAARLQDRSADQVYFIPALLAVLERPELTAAWQAGDLLCLSDLA